MLVRSLPLIFGLWRVLPTQGGIPSGTPTGLDSIGPSPAPILYQPVDQRQTLWSNPFEGFQRSDPLLKLQSMSGREFLFILGAAGLTALLIHGLQASREEKKKRDLPFGHMPECQNIIRDETFGNQVLIDLRIKRLGKALVDRLDESARDLDQALAAALPFRRPVKQIRECCEDKVLFYIHALDEIQDEFRRGLHLLDQREDTKPYEKAFSEFLREVDRLVSAMRWECERSDKESDFQVVSWYNEDLQKLLREFDISQNAR